MKDLYDKAELSPAVTEVERFLQQHYQNMVHLEELGKIANLNPQYLTVVFRRETGLTISDYVRQLRMQTAQELLAATTMSIGDVASAVGYQDARYFRRVFHQEFGQTPRQYRSDRISEFHALAGDG